MELNSDMRLLAWLGKTRGKASVPNDGLVRREIKVTHTHLAREQRELAERVERVLRHLEKQLTMMAERIRHTQGTRTELLGLEAEQCSQRRLLARVEVANLATAELLHEWRDWLHKIRHGQQGMV